MILTGNLFKAYCLLLEGAKKCILIYFFSEIIEDAYFKSSVCIYVMFSKGRLLEARLQQHVLHRLQTKISWRIYFSLRVCSFWNAKENIPCR